MQTKTIVIAVALSMAFMGMVPTNAIGTPLELEKSRFIVGFFSLPADQETYGGDPVVKVDEDLVYFVVETKNAAGLQVRAALDDNVRYIESDVSDHQLQFTPNDYYWSHASNWGVKKIGAEQAWDRTLGSTSIKDVHIDSGIVATHEDLSGSRFLQGYDYYNNDGTPQDESGCNWHGSHTAGTVAATIDNGLGFAGMAQITVEPMKIFGGQLCWAASTSGLADALKAAGDNGGHVSSNSWGGGSFSQAIHDAITYSTNLGTIFVASSGNGGCSNCVGNPWVQQASNTIIVTATDSSDAGASFNSEGSQVDVSAPGVYVGSAGGPGSSYYIMDGTSMAAPHVAGLVGLVKSLNPSWDRAQVTDKITSTAVDLGAPGHDNTFGWGRIDADAATAGGTPPPAQCNDGIDNDGDGLTDYPADPGCTDANDDDEYNAPPADPQCSDGIDNDGDGLTDFPADPGCTDANDDDEYNAPPGQDMHVSALAGSFAHANRGKHTLYCDVSIADAGGAAVSGASVTITMTAPNGNTASGTASTDGNGDVAFSWDVNKKHGTATCDVDNVVLSGWNYDSAANVASSVSWSVT